MKTALITGASRGIGRAVCHRFAAAGYHVLAVSRDSDPLRDLADDLAGRCSICPADVRDAAAISQIVAAAVADHGGVDVLVNNAGECLRGDFASIDQAEYESMIDTNVTGLVTCTRSVWPVMQNQKSGVVVNVSSLATTYLTRGFAVYAATKGFVETMTRSLAEEGRPLGIRCYAVTPGFVETGLRQRVNPEMSADRSLPPAEVAEMVYSFCTPAHRFGSGSIVRMQR